MNDAPLQAFSCRSVEDSSSADPVPGRVLQVLVEGIKELFGGQEGLVLAALARDELGEVVLGALTTVYLSPAFWFLAAAWLVLGVVLWPRRGNAVPSASPALSPGQSD